MTGGKERQEQGREQITQGKTYQASLVICFHSGGDEEPLEGFEQRRDMK